MKSEFFNYHDAAAKPGPKSGQVKPGALAGASGALGGRPAGPGVLPGQPIPAHMAYGALMRSLAGALQKNPSEFDFGRVYGQGSGGFNPWSR